MTVGVFEAVLVAGTNAWFTKREVQTWGFVPAVAGKLCRIVKNQTLFLKAVRNNNICRAAAHKKCALH